MKIWCIIVVLQLGYLSVFSQSDFKKDMVEVSKNMEKTKSYSVRLQYSLFIDDLLTKAYQTRQVMVNYESNKLNFIQETDIEIIENETETVKINNRDKCVYYSKHKAKKALSDQDKDNEVDKMYKVFAEKFDSLKQYIDKIELVSNSNGIKEYEVFYNEGEITRMKIGLNMKKKVYTYTQLTYWEKRKVKRDDEKLSTITMRVDYKDYVVNPVFKPSTFTTDRVLQKKENKKIELSQKFKNYKLIVL